MRVSHAHTVLSDPERLARIQEHQARIEAEMPTSDRRTLYRKRRKKQPPKRLSHDARWARRIDLINAMAANPGVVGWRLRVTHK